MSDTYQNKFGSINIETGEMREGFIDKNGKQQLKRLPWYKRIFIKPPRETVYEGLGRFTRFNNEEFMMPLYKEINPYTNKIYSIYTISATYGKVEYDIPSFINYKKLIAI